MRVAVGKIRDSRLTIIHPALPAARPLAKSVRLSQLRKNRKCEQVAAVCYRIRNGAIEFLLVQTRNRKRWTFPKGSAEPGLSHAQAAALEAFEEAGVHGRIEETPFTEYLRYRRCDKQNLRGSSVKRPAVSAHLCEVLSLRLPKESNRNRTWFSVQETPAELAAGTGEGGGGRVRPRSRRCRTAHSAASEGSWPRRRSPSPTARRPRTECPPERRTAESALRVSADSSAVLRRIANRVRRPKTFIASRSWSANSCRSALPA